VAQEFTYEWQGLLQDAILEFQPEKLRAKVQTAEAAIFDRAQALSLFLHGNHEERQAIEDALSTLRVLRKNNSAFPE
jgi:hypothetical protein